MAMLTAATMRDADNMGSLIAADGIKWSAQVGHLNGGVANREL